MRRLLLALVLSCLVIVSIPFGKAQANYQPGVKPGDTITYGQVSASWVSDLKPQSPVANFLNISSIQNTITAVDQNNVTLQQIKTYNNGTTSRFHLLYNVQSGYGNYTPTIAWVNAMGLVSPEATYETPQAPTITQTVEKVYLGRVRTVNVITQFQVFSGGYFSDEEDFDQQTGILLYLTFTEVYSNIYYVTAHLNILVTQTSLWSPPVPPDFAVYANPFAATILKGSSVNSTLTLQSLNGFHGTASLSQTTTPSGPGVTLNMTARTIPANSGVNVLLNFSAMPSLAAGVYKVNVTVTVGSISHSTVLNFTVIGPSYRLNPAQAYVAVPTNSSGTDSVTLASLGGFSGTVTLKAVPLTAGPLLSLSPSTIIVKAGTNTTTLTITTHLVPAGFYTLQINGTGPLIQTVYVYLQVLPGPPDFSISLNPALTSYDVSTGQAVTYITLTSVNGFVGTINLNLYWINGTSDTFLGLNNPTLSAYQTTSIQLKVFSPPISLGCCGILQVQATSVSLTHYANFSIYVPPGPDFTVSVSPSSVDIPQGVSATANVTVTNTGTVEGAIQLSASPSAGFGGGWAFSPNSVVLQPGASGTVLFEVLPTAPTLGRFNFTIDAHDNTHDHTLRFALTVLPPSAGFTVTASSIPITMQTGSSTSTNVVLTSINSFYANISLSASAGSSGLIFAWTPQKVLLSANATASSTLSITVPVSATSGKYNVTVSASGNGILHTAIITVQISSQLPTVSPDFKVTADPSQLSMQPGYSATASVSLEGLNRFNGTINLSITVTGSGPIFNLSANPVVLSYSVPTSSATLTISVPASTRSGTYTITISATNGTATRQAVVVMTVAQSSGPSSPSTNAPYLPYLFGIGVLTVLISSLAALFIIIRRRRHKDWPRADIPSESPLNK